MAPFLQTTPLLNILKNKMILIAYVFPKLQTAKCVVRQMFKNVASEYPSIVNMLNGHAYL